MRDTDDCTILRDDAASESWDYKRSYEHEQLTLVNIEINPAQCHNLSVSFPVALRHTQAANSNTFYLHLLPF